MTGRIGVNVCRAYGSIPDIYSSGLIARKQGILPAFSKLHLEDTLNSENEKPRYFNKVNKLKCVSTILDSIFKLPNFISSIHSGVE